MGTRADFYLGIGIEAEWLGSIALDGYPEGLPELKKTKTRREFCNHVQGYAVRDDFTKPAMGWPWPWNDSQTTDFSYHWYKGKVLVACFGHGYVNIKKIFANLKNLAKKYFITEILGILY